MPRPNPMRGFDGTPVTMAVKSLQSAQRALAMASQPDAAQLCPSPLIIVQAELRQTMRFLELLNQQEGE
jgi:hypothetical protein